MLNSSRLISTVVVYKMSWRPGDTLPTSPCLLFGCSMQRTSSDQWKHNGNKSSLNVEQLRYPIWINCKLTVNQYVFLRLGSLELLMVWWTVIVSFQQDGNVVVSMSSLYCHLFGCWRVGDWVLFYDTVSTIQAIIPSCTWSSLDRQTNGWQYNPYCWEWWHTINKVTHCSQPILISYYTGDGGPILFESQQWENVNSMCDNAFGQKT